MPADRSMGWQPKRTLAWGLVVFAFALSFAALRVGVLTEIAGVRMSARWAMLDFDSGAYYPVRAFLAGENPYDRERFLSLYPVSDGFPPYPPFTLLLHLPFALLPHTAAAVAYAVFTVGLTCLLAWLSLRWVLRKPTAGAVLLLAGLLLLTRPGHWNLVLGQRAALLALGAYIAIRYAEARPWWSALGLTVAMVKPTWGVPLAVLLLARGNLRAVAAGVLATLILNVPLLAIIVHRAGGLRAFLARVTAGYQQWQAVSDVSPVTSSVRIDATTSVSRFLGAPLSDPAQLLLTALIIAAAALAVYLLRNDRSPEAEELTVGTMCTGVLLCGHHVGYDFLLLTVPALGVLFHGLPGTRGPLTRWTMLALFAVPALNWAATESVLRALRPSPALWLGIASLNGAVLFVLFGTYLWLGTRWRARLATVDSPRWADAPSKALASPDIAP